MTIVTRTRFIAAAFSLAALAILFVPGCTSRGITITSSPPGAEVSINRRVVGVTPIRVGFNHYGTYRIELRMDRYQTLVREEDVKPGLYGYDPVAAVADNIIPARLNDEVYLHYVLKPLSSEKGTDRAALLDRAILARSGTVTHPKRGDQVQVAFGRPSPAAETSLVADKPGDTSAGTQASAEFGPVKGIDTPQPKGPQLQKELHLEAENDAAGEFREPGGAAKKTAVIRTPKNEELIYQEPAKKDTKEKKDEKAKQ